MGASHCNILLCLGLMACESTPSTMTAQPAVEVAAYAPLPPAMPAPPVSLPEEEPGSRQFWVNPDQESAQAAQRLQTTQPREAGWLRKIAEQPSAIWFTAKTREPAKEAARLAQAVAGTTQYLVAVIAALPKRDCAGFVTPGLSPAAYSQWIQDLARGLGETPIYWIVEPEALQLTGCLKSEEMDERLKLIAESVLVLKTNPKAQVYIDVGIPGWLSVEDAVARLLKAGVLTVDGFALNVGRYEWTEDCIQYGQEISQKIGGKGFVIDSSRNGKGPGPRHDWCNPKRRAIGQTPQAPTGIKGLDAYLWLKQPGVSDGSCQGGPAAGLWWEAQAIELMRNAIYPDD